MACKCEGRETAHWWLALDQNDNEPALFWSYVVAALQTLRPEFDQGQSTLALLRSLQPLPVETALSRMLNELGSLEGSEFDESLSNGAREFRGRVHPSLMSGEYLPDYEGDEVEIARVALASVMGDVISIRARHQGSSSVTESWTSTRVKALTTASPRNRHVR
jgi:hypothetical protein